MYTKNDFVALCIENLKNKNLDIPIYKERLRLEMREIAAKEEHTYFLELYQQKKHFPKNENNLLVPYLLDLVDDFDITKPPQYEYGDFPDIDSDFIEGVREYLKDEFAPKTFGEEYVCNIANYSTFGIKSALK